MTLPSWPNYFKGSLKPKACDPEIINAKAKFAHADRVIWSFKTCGLFTEQMESVRIFENLLADMETIKCEGVMYEKYATAAKDL